MDTSLRYAAVMALGAAVASCGGDGIDGEPPAPTGRWMGAERIDGTPLPPGPASGSGRPSVGMDGSGRAVVVWSQNTTIWANGFVQGQGWGQPEAVVVLSQAHAGEVALAVNRVGVALAAWDQIEGEGNSPPRLWVSWSEPSSGWSRPEVVVGAARHSSGAIAVALDEAGRAVILWSVDDGISALHYAPDQGWAPTERLSDRGGAPLVSMDDLGQSVAAWSEGSTGVGATHDLVRGWSASVRFGPGVEGDFLQGSLALDSSGRGVVAWERSTISQSSMLSCHPKKFWKRRFRMKRPVISSPESTRLVLQPLTLVSPGCSAPTDEVVPARTTRARR